MRPHLSLVARTVFCAGTALAPIAAAIAAPQHPPMLIDNIPEIWPGQRAVRPADYPKDQATVRADVARFLKGRFRVIGDRLSVIPPNQGIILRGGPFLLGGPDHFNTIDSACIFNLRPDVKNIMRADDPTDFTNTSITIGATRSSPKIYTAIALHAITGSNDELIAYFQLEPLVADPAKSF